MKNTEFNNAEYISGIFKGLSTERKDYLLDTARALLEIQDDKSYLVDNKAVSQTKKDDDVLVEISSANAGEKI